jgi:CRP/FNR family transcriptional regulator
MPTHTPRCSDFDCSACPARPDSVFAELTTSELSPISDAKKCRIYKKGEIIFYADEHPSGLYCIREGKIKVYKTGAEGREHITHLARPGDVLGYRALISGDVYAEYAVPLETSHVCHIPGGTVLAMLAQNRTLMSGMMNMLSHDLKAAEERIVELAQKPVRERLAEALLELADTYGLEEDRSTLSVTLTRGEIAEIVGTATESVSRMLSTFRTEDLIAIDGRKILITDRDRLARIAGL